MESETNIAKENNNFDNWKIILSIAKYLSISYINCYTITMYIYQ